MSCLAELPPESAWSVDEKTGQRVRQVTSHPSIHHHPFFLASAYDDRMTRLFFVSHRLGYPALFSERNSDGALEQWTDRSDLDEWSMVPSPDGRFLYYTAGGSGYRVHLETGEHEHLVSFPEHTPLAMGGVAGDMGTTALSRDGQYWAVHYKENNQKTLAVIDTGTGRSRIVTRGSAIGHIQFCPDDPDLIAYAGPHVARMRLASRTQGNDRLLHEQAPGQWLTHEVWLPGRRELAVVDWPRRILGVSVDTGETRTIANFNAWHLAPSRDGRYLVADTNHPDIGIQIVDLETGSRRTLCHPQATNQGEHWKGPFPYGAGPVKVYAPQHTHPHPSFSPDGERVVFTSNRSNHSQVYEVIVD